MVDMPNYTQIPNEFLERMHEFSGAAAKVFLSICRRTIGWHKTSDQISYSQIMDMTGLSKNAVRSAIFELQKAGFIVCKERKPGHAPVYDVYFKPQETAEKTSEEGIKNSEGVPKNGIPKSGRGYQKVTRGVSKSGRGGVSKSDPTKESINKNLKKGGEREKKIEYADGVYMTEKEYQSLTHQYPKKTVDSTIDKISLWQEANGRKYKSYAAAVRMWLKKDGLEPRKNILDKPAAKGAPGICPKCGGHMTGFFCPACGYDREVDDIAS